MPIVPPSAEFTSDVSVGDEPLDVNFTDQSTPGISAITSWTWDFGDGAMSTVQNPSHTYDVVGSYTVSLTVTSTDGSDTAVKVDFITVTSTSINPPSAEFTVDRLSGTAPLAVVFTDQSTPGSSAITTWEWDFGDSNTSTLPNPMHIFMNVGTYTVALTVTSDDGSDTMTKTGFITVTTGVMPPTANFSADTTFGDIPLEVNFTDQSTSGTSPITAWEWDLGDGNMSSDQNPSHTYSSAGTYSVTLAVTSASGSDMRTRTNFITAADPTLSPTIITSTSPSVGEDSVAVTRETVIYFDRPLTPSTVTPAAIFAEQGGQPLDTLLHLSPDARTATLFYDADLPASSRIDVVIDGDILRDSDGLAVDADADGSGGGFLLLEFDTLSITPVANTAVIGRVFASELASTPRGVSVNTPLQTVTITVDGTGGSLQATTDALGNFRLDPAPAGRFFVHIDGRTATNTGQPAGTYYPFVGKSWTAAPGEETSIGDVYLPLVAPGTLQAVSTTQDTTITFPDSVLAAYPELDGVQITVPADSLYHNNGARGGSVGIAPVPPDRLPGQLPPGIDPALVITVQSDGATNFDVPVPVRFPNLPNPSTGETLPPGAASALWAFNHDTGRFTVIGSMTVSADGLFVDSDPGVGVLAPGWLHSTLPRSVPVGGGGGDSDDCPTINPDGCVTPTNPDPNKPPPDPCEVPAALLQSAIEQCGIAAAASLGISTPAYGCVIGGILNLEGVLSDCNIDPNGCGSTVMQGTFGTMLGCVPIVGGPAGTAFSCLYQMGNAENALLDCRGQRSRSHSGDNTYFQQITLLEDSYRVYNRIFGSSVWTEFETEEVGIMQDFMAQFEFSFDPGSDEGETFSSAERDFLLAMPRATSISIADVDALIDRFTALFAGDLTNFDTASISSALSTLSSTANELQSLGWKTTVDGLDRAMEISSRRVSDVVVVSGGIDQVSHYFKLTNLSDETDMIRRGRLTALGTFAGVNIPVDSRYLAQYLDPISLKTGSTYFSSDIESGFAPDVPKAFTFNVEGADADSDGLTDFHEDILGTNPNNNDTDGDGLLDRAELEIGKDPLDPTSSNVVGILASVDTPGEALGVYATDEMIIVADGLEGIAVFNAFTGMNPSIIAQIDTQGIAHAVACENGLVAVADWDFGLTLIDIFDPTDPKIVAEITMGDLGGNANGVAIHNGTVYVGTDTGGIVAVSRTGVIKERTFIAGISGVEDVVVEQNVLYAVSDSGLHVLKLAAGALQIDATLTMFLPVSLGFDPRLRVTVGDGIAYIVRSSGYITVDVADPLNPTLIAPVSSPQAGWRQMALNGAGLGIVAADLFGAGDVPIYDTSDSSVTNNLQGTIVTPGQAHSTALLNAFAYVGDGDSGLQVIKYRQDDIGIVPPVVSFTTDAGGTDVEEGSVLLVTATVSDDVEVRSVELLVDGILSQRDGNFPFEFLLNITPNAAPDMFGLSMIASDTAGNRAETAVQDFTIIGDTAAPEFVVSNPAHNRLAFDVNKVDVVFNEAINMGSLSVNDFTLTDLGPDAMLGGGDDLLIDISSVTAVDSRTVRVVPDIADPLARGVYQFAIAPSTAVDQSGNVLASAINILFAADLAPIGDEPTWLSLTDGEWSDPNNWYGGEVPDSLTPSFVVDIPGVDVTITVSEGDGLGAVRVTDFIIEESLLVTNSVDFFVHGTGVINGDLILDPGSVFQVPAGGNATINGGVFADGATLHVAGGMLSLPNVVSMIGTTMQVSQAGTTSAPVLTSFTNGSFSVSNVGTLLDVPLLTNIDDTKIGMAGGSTLDLSNVATYTINEYIASFIELQSGDATSLDLSGLMTLTLNVPSGIPPSMSIVALKGFFTTGSTIDMSALTTIVHQEANPLTFRSDGTGSVINVGMLATYDAGLVTFTPQNGGIITGPAVP
jgi:PKD repeat protein